MARAGTTQSIGSVENITSPNENIPENAGAAHNADENKVRRQSYSIDKNEVGRQSKRLKDRKYRVKILVLGLTGAGKSTLVNAMMGDIVAVSEAGARACSTGIECHKGEHDGIKIKIYDTAGFGESDISERKVLKNIAERENTRKGYDLILIAIRMDNRLDTVSARNMLSSLGHHMHPEMWKRSIVVLTFANFCISQLKNGYLGYNTISEEAIMLQVERKAEGYKEVFQQHTGINLDLINEIPFLLAGNIGERKLPTDDDWLITLWDQSILRCRTEIQPFLKRIRFQRLFVDLRLMIQNIFPVTSERDSSEQHGECHIQNGVEQSVGPNSEERNDQGVPAQEEQVPLTDDSNGLEQNNGQSMGEEEMSVNVNQQQNSLEQNEPRDGDSNLQEDGLERMEFDLLSEIDSAVPMLND